MSTSVSGVYSAQPAVVPPAVKAPTPGTPAPQTPADTVTLSQAAQVSQLSEQGASPSQISQSLGIAETTVDLDLGVVAASSAPLPAAHPAERTHAAPAHATPAPAATTGVAAPAPAPVSAPA